MNHQHKPIENRTRTYGFSGCVSPHYCNPASHGCVVEVEECTCGAIRSANINQNCLEQGPWVEPAPLLKEHPRDPLREKARELARTLMSQDGGQLIANGRRAARNWLERATAAEDIKSLTLIIEVGLDALAEAWDALYKAR